MQYLNWNGTYTTTLWGDLGSPGDRPKISKGGEVSGIANSSVWGDGQTPSAIIGTADADVIFFDLKGYDGPRLNNVSQVRGGDGNDLIDMTSDRFSCAAVSLYGGNGQDSLLGNSGRDRVFGQSGADLLKGYAASDYLSGGANNDSLHGGRGNDELNGGSGHDHLSGGFGRDTLVGGSGHDRFIFDVSPSRSNMDIVKDFSVRDDIVHLARAVFTKAGAKGALKAKAFWTGSEAHDADDRVIYNENTGYLFYDPDGTGGAAQRTIAKLSKNLDLTHKDFLLF